MYWWNDTNGTWYETLHCIARDCWLALYAITRDTLYALEFTTHPRIRVPCLVCGGPHVVNMHARTQRNASTHETHTHTECTHTHIMFMLFVRLQTVLRVCACGFCCCCVRRVDATIKLTCYTQSTCGRTTEAVVAISTTTCFTACVQLCNVHVFIVALVIFCVVVGVLIVRATAAASVTATRRRCRRRCCSCL